MATFVFENMTQAQADALQATDVIAFATTTVNARNVGVANSTQLNTDTITLTSNIPPAAPAEPTTAPPSRATCRRASLRPPSPSG